MKSKELQVLQESFETHTGLKTRGTIEEKDFPHFKRLVLPQLNCVQLYKVTYFIMDTFTTPNTFEHTRPKVHSYNNLLVLTVDVKQIQKHLIV